MAVRVTLLGEIDLPGEADNEHGWWLRVYQAGGSEWSAISSDDAFDNKEIIVRCSSRDPVVVFWLGTYDSTTTLPGQLPWQTKSTRGFGWAPLVDGYNVPVVIFDPSVRDRGQNYLPLMTIDVDIDGSPFTATEAATYEQALSAVMDKAKMEMVSSERAKNRLQRMYTPVIPVAEGIFLNRFTAVSGQMTAASFVAVGRNDPAMDRDVLEQLVRFACVLHNEHFDVVMRNIESIIRGGKLDMLPSVLAIMVEAVVFTAVSSIYVGDHAGRREVERFQIPTCQRLGQCDCEDCAKETQYCVQSITKIADIIEMPMSTDDPVYPFVALLRHYTPLMNTGLATSPSLPRMSDMKKEAGDDMNNYICHVWATLVPAAVWDRWRGTPRGRAETPLSKAIESAGTLLCEGTNFTAALHQPMTAYYPTTKAAQVAVDRMSAVKQMRDEIERNPATRALAKLDYSAPCRARLTPPQSFDDISTFYRVVLSVWGPNDDDEGPFAFNLVQGSEFGVSFYDLLRCAPDIRAIPAYKRSLTNDELDMALATEPPRKPLSVGSMHLTGPRSFPYKPFVEWRVQHLNQVTPEIREAIEALRETHTVEFFDYFLTTNIHGISQIKATPKD